MKFIIETPKRHANKNGMYGQPIAILTINEEVAKTKSVVDLYETLLDAGFNMSH